MNIKVRTRATRDFRQSEREARLLAKGKLSLKSYGDGRRPILGKQQRDKVCENVRDAISTWTASPFEHEGTARAALRSGFCLGGNSWVSSDLEAEEILSRVFAVMGANRPTWEQGQWNYVQGSDYCAWCGRGLDQPGHAGGDHHRYCSGECAKAALEKRVYVERRSRDKAYDAVGRAVRRYSMPEKVCIECGNHFHPEPRAKGEFCSSACSAKARPKRQQRVAECIVCRNPFVARHPTAVACGMACNQVIHKARVGKWEPQQFTRAVFEQFVVGPVTIAMAKNDGFHARQKAA